MKLSLFSLTLSFIATPLGYSMTPSDVQLLAAASSTDLDQAQESLLNGANINTISRNGSTPLHYAAECTCTKMVKLLLNANANVNIQDKYDYNTPLHRAIKYNRAEVVKLLVEHGTDIMLKDIKKRTALDIARNKNNFTILKILEEYQVLQKEAQERATKETLCKAIQGNYPNLVILVLKNGVIANSKDLCLAQELGNKEIGQILIKYLGATTGQYTIAKNSILNLGLPTYIAQHIMSQTL